MDNNQIVEASIDKQDEETQREQLRAELEAKYAEREPLELDCE
jgi:hypothetical protein